MEKNMEGNRKVRPARGVLWRPLLPLLLTILVLSYGCDNEGVPEYPQITSYAFLANDNPALAEDCIGTIIDSDNYIDITVPYGTDVEGLVASFTSTGTTVYVEGTSQMSGETSNNFIDGVSYTVVGDDGSFYDYFVSVTIALNSAKDLTSFFFPAAQNSQFPVDHQTEISGTTITSTVVSGTVLTGLVASFESTGEGVTVGGVAQESGTTANDFSFAVVYTVHAENGSTIEYTVNIVVSSLAYGDSHVGGLLFYLDGLGHGLVAATVDQGMAIWSPTNIYIGGTGREIGTGAANTVAIVAEFGDGAYAAKSCADLTLNGYSDWFLPSMDELSLMYINLHLAGVGDFGATFSRYFSSTEISSQAAYAMDFSSGVGNLPGVRASNFQVRAARAF